MKNLFLLLGIITMLASACSKKPEASFSPSIQFPNLGDTIQMTNASLNATSYIWTFGDGTTSLEENPAKVYELPGTYTVTLTAFGEEDKRSSQAIEMIEIAEPEFYVYMKLDSTTVVKHYAGDSALLNNSVSEMVVNTSGTSYGTYVSQLRTPDKVFFSIRKGVLDYQGGTSTPTNNEFSSFFNPGSYNYLVTSNLMGVEVNYYIDGTLWSTSQGSADQTGSIFQIISKTEVNDTSGFHVKVKCLFECKIYSPTGTSRKIKGTFVGLFSNEP